MTTKQESCCDGAIDREDLPLRPLTVVGLLLAPPIIMTLFQKVAVQNITETDAQLHFRRSPKSVVTFNFHCNDNDSINSAREQLCKSMLKRPHRATHVQCYVILCCEILYQSHLYLLSNCWCPRQSRNTKDSDCRIRQILNRHSLPQHDMKPPKFLVILHFQIARIFTPSISTQRLQASSDFLKPQHPQPAL